MIDRFNEMDHDFAVTIAKSFDYEVGEPKHPNHGKKTTGQQPISMLVSIVSILAARGSQRLARRRLTLRSSSLPSTLPLSVLIS